MLSRLFPLLPVRLAAALLVVAAAAAAAPGAARADAAPAYSAQEIVASGPQFFGAPSGGLASRTETSSTSHGMPNGYSLGEEGSGALIGGLTYGEGTLYTKNVGDHRVYGQGPSLGWDFGGQGSRTMILVYNLDSIPSLYQRYAGVAGSAYVIAGLGFTVLKHGDVLLVPVRTGVGARLGINVGYLKLTQSPTWNPF